MRLLNIIEDKVQESGFPAVAFGRGTSGTSGYAIGQYNEGARVRLNLPRSNAALGITQLSHLMVGLAETYAPDTAIPVWGHFRNKTFFTQLTGNNMRGHVIEVTISEDLPADQLRNATIGGQLKAQDAISDRTLQERYLGIEDPDEEMEQKLIEKAMSNPLWQGVQMLRALSVDKDPAAQLVQAEVAKMIPMMMAPTAGPGPAAPRGESPQAKPKMLPSQVIPPIAQGQVLRQQQGLPPTEQEMWEK
jgi:hypothetical protein